MYPNKIHVFQIILKTFIIYNFHNINLVFYILDAYISVLPDDVIIFCIS